MLSSMHAVKHLRNSANAVEIDVNFACWEEIDLAEVPATVSGEAGTVVARISCRLQVLRVLIKNA